MKEAGNVGRCIRKEDIVAALAYHLLVSMLQGGSSVDCEFMGHLEFAVAKAGDPLILSFPLAREFLCSYSSFDPIFVVKGSKPFKDCLLILLGFLDLFAYVLVSSLL